MWFHNINNDSIANEHYYYELTPDSLVLIVARPLPGLPQPSPGELSLFWTCSDDRKGDGTVFLCTQYEIGIIWWNLFSKSKTKTKLQFLEFWGHLYFCFGVNTLYSIHLFVRHYSQGSTEINSEILKLFVPWTPCHSGLAIWWSLQTPPVFWMHIIKYKRLRRKHVTLKYSNTCALLSTH